MKTARLFLLLWAVIFGVSVVMWCGSGMSAAHHTGFDWFKLAAGSGLGAVFILSWAVVGGSWGSF